VEVECYAGSRGDETPLRFREAERQVEIAQVIDRWMEPGCRLFKLRDTEGALHVLRNDVVSDCRELTRSP
jgi:hypothetical protein